MLRDVGFPQLRSIASRSLAAPVISIASSDQLVLDLDDV